MTRKDFRLIEDILRDIRRPLDKPKFGDAWTLVVLAFGQALSLQYARFDKDKFLHRCMKE
jgi:hypothetical protein